MQKIQKIILKNYNLDKINNLSSMAILLKKHIVQNNLFVDIVGKKYVMVEGWQFAGGLLGLRPQVVKVDKIDTNEWLAQVNIIDKNNKVLSSGFALCSKKEMKKNSFDEYAIVSMAQTRAIGKAYRNLLGWIMKLAGYEATPAEEMENIPVVDQNQKTGIDYLSQLKKKLYKLGAKNETEALDILHKKTGLIWKDFENATQKMAQLALVELTKKIK